MFLVRKGNPKGIKDWSDLVKPGVGVITPNPKTSGGARWNYLAAWEYAKRQPGGNDAKAREFVAQLFKNVPVLDSGARGATTTFVQRGIGDVLLAWENEAYLALARRRRARSRSSSPSLSILAEPPVAVVDKVVDKKGTRAAGRGVPAVPLHAGGAGDRREAPLPAARRRRSRRSTRARSPQVKLFTIDEAFGGWQAAQKAHFADGGTFDQIYRPGAVADATHVRRSVLPGFRLTMGFTLFYLCLIVLVPLLTLPARTASMTWDAFWQTITDPRVVASYQLSIGASLVAACVNAVFGLIVAWVLVRYPFPGPAASSTRWSICRSRCRPRSPASR